jgi:hypothetical protein
MSTKRIKEALQRLKEEGGWDETVREALEDVEAIEKAARHLSAGDLSADGTGQTSSDAWATIDAIARESGQ